jgi:hypothetical protein
MPTDFAEVKRLILQLQRDLVAQADMRVLLGHATSTVKRHRKDLRTVKARIKRGAKRRTSGRTR